MINIKLQDGKIIQLQNPMRICDIAKKISISLGKKTFAGYINKLFYPLDFIIDYDTKLEFITRDSQAATKLTQYNTALVIAKAIKDLFPYAQICDIQASFNSFYIDFYSEPSIKKSELKAIHKQSQKIINNNYKFNFVKYNPKQHNKTNPFLSDDFYDFEHVIAINDNFIRSFFSPMPIKFIKKFEINSLAGAYWKGNADNKMLQRLSGFGTINIDFFKILQDRNAENVRNDHRRLGKQMEIFTFSPLIGQGLPIWLPNGTVIRRQIAKYIEEKEWEYDCVQVETPILGTRELYEISGHLDHYKNDMFPVFNVGGEDLILRPMACPSHIMVYNSKPHSSRELPIRYSEQPILHRYEASGGLSGLERVRMMTLTDSHIFVQREKLKDEFKRCFKLINEVLATFKIKIHYLLLSTRDINDSDKYYGDDNMWNKSEAILKEALNELKVDYQIKTGEAAFYGPKMDVQVKNLHDKEITVSTIQLDFLMPKKFNVFYYEGENKVHPIIIHRGLIGTYERFISILLEQTKGNLPFWLCPTQITVIPINEDHHLKYAYQIQKKLKQNYIRSFVDNRDERLNYKIREAQIKKIPYQIIIGDEEVANNTIAVRPFGNTTTTKYKLVDFLKITKNHLKERI